MISHFAFFIAAGLATGIFSGSLGVGGALIATPLIRFLGVAPYLAVGTTVPVMLPTALTGAFTYHRQKLVHLKAVVLTAPTAAVASVVGALTTRRVNGHYLMLMTAGLIVFAAIRLFPRRGGGASSHEDIVVNPAGFVGLGAVAGFFSGLLGVGGGFVMVPAFIQLFRFPTKLALGTSLAVISITVIPNLTAQALVGNIDWRVALALSIGVVPGARIGALTAIRAPERVLRYVITFALIAVGVLYARLELSALFS